MLYTPEEYNRNLQYVGGIFTLGGLSECGKTTAGYRFQALGVRRSKIIQIEHEMMRARGVDPEQSLGPDIYEDLYRDDPEATFAEFLFRLIEKMKAENFKFASLESLYRAPMGVFIKQELGKRCANIYIDAPLQDRAARERIKVNKKALEEGRAEISLEDMVAQVSKKDEFKTSRRAEDVRLIADFIVSNASDVSLDTFLAEIDSIAAGMGVPVQAAS